MLRRNRDEKLKKKYFEIWELNNKNTWKYRYKWIGVGLEGRKAGSIKEGEAGGC